MVCIKVTNLNIILLQKTSQELYGPKRHVYLGLPSLPDFYIVLLLRLNFRFDALSLRSSKLILHAWIYSFRIGNVTTTQLLLPTSNCHGPIQPETGYSLPAAISFAPG